MQSLTTKYQPKRVKDFAGLAKAKAIMGKLIASPYESGWALCGDSGTGKTTMAMAVAEEIGAEVHHLSSGQCDKAAVAEVCNGCQQSSFFAKSRWHVIIVDEADGMTTAAQNSWLSRLDTVSFPKNAIIFFTMNGTAKLEDRFMSRLKRIDFDGAIDAKEFGDLLYAVWFDEAPTHATAPMMHKIMADSKNNVRKALNDIEMELLMVPAAPVKARMYA